jgi:hypothetical protein
MAVSSNHPLGLPESGFLLILVEEGCSTRDQLTTFNNKLCIARDIFASLCADPSSDDASISVFAVRAGTAERLGVKVQPYIRATAIKNYAESLAMNADYETLAKLVDKTSQTSLAVPIALKDVGSNEEVDKTQVDVVHASVLKVLNPPEFAKRKEIEAEVHIGLHGAGTLASLLHTGITFELGCLFRWLAIEADTRWSMETNPSPP